jgi:hypothetical protein
MVMTTSQKSQACKNPFRNKKIKNIEDILGLLSKPFKVKD